MQKKRTFLLQHCLENRYFDPGIYFFGNMLEKLSFAGKCKES